MTVEPHPHGRVFTAGVGLGHDPVGDDWDAFDSEHLWFAKPPHQVCRGDHIFALGAGRRSAVLGLFEVTSGGPIRLDNPWDPERWPWAISVRPVAAVPPPVAKRVDGVVAPRATAARVWEEADQAALYAALR
jgi:hypothetical protein